MLVVFGATGALLGCPGRKQVPFGLQDAGAASDAATTDETVEAPALPVGEPFAPDQVEILLVSPLSFSKRDMR